MPPKRKPTAKWTPMSKKKVKKVSKKGKGQPKDLANYDNLDEPDDDFNDDDTVQDTLGQPSNKLMTQMSSGALILSSFQHSSDMDSANESSLESKESKEVSMSLGDEAKDVSVATHLGNEPLIEDSTFSTASAVMSGYGRS
jgi:hypothetical protein